MSKRTNKKVQMYIKRAEAAEKALVTYMDSTKLVTITGLSKYVLKGLVSDGAHLHESYMNSTPTYRERLSDQHATFVVKDMAEFFRVYDSYSGCDNGDITVMVPLA